MPSGSQKRKSAKKKKKKTKSSPNSVSSSPVPSPHRESDGEQLSSPASKDQQDSPGPEVKPETNEGNLSRKNSSTIEKTEKAAEVKEGKEGKTEADKGSSSPKQHAKSISRSSSSRDKRKSVVIEPAPVTDLVKSFESLPEKGLGSAIKTSPIVDQIYNNSKLKENNDLLAARSPMKQKVVNENSSKNDLRSSPKFFLVENSVSLDDGQKESPESKDCLTSSTLECPFCGRNSDDNVNENGSPECSERQHLLALAPQEAERTSWKSCCGIFGLCSGSSR